MDMETTGKNPSRRSLPTRKGVLVLWNDNKGFGFVRPEEGAPDHFVHISAFKHKGGPLLRRPMIGDTVLFTLASERPGKNRIAHARIEGMEQEPIRPRSTPVIPKPRSLALTALISAPLALSGLLLWEGISPFPFFCYTFFSVLTILLYGTDKILAARRSWRVPEMYLHVLELFGGWPGALIAQNDFRHKTRKSTYQWVVWGIIALHGCGWLIFLVWHFHPQAFS